MELPIKALVIDGSESSANSLLEDIAPDLEFGEVEFCSSISEALQFYLETNYEICFVADIFRPKFLAGFFSDIRQIKEGVCNFVLVREEKAPVTDLSEFYEMGVNLVMTRACTRRDINELRKLLDEHIRQVEIVERIDNIDKSLGLVFREIDRAAASKKRGRETKIDAGVMDYIKKQMDYDIAVMQRYFGLLMEKIEEAEPVATEKVAVPQTVLERNLPGLTEKGYTGASERVWKLLQDIFPEEIKGGSVSEENGEESDSDEGLDE